MRFVPEGPDIPADLVKAQEQGEVLFICGAGISRGAGLPLFRGLVQLVYQELGEEWTPYPAESEVMKDDGQLARQYDRMLRALERRLAAGDVPRSQGMRERIRRAIRTALTPRAGADLENHISLLRLSRDAESRTRILTTNFDTLFEQAWRSMGMPELHSYAGQGMPRPKAAAFSGVLHLHGRLADASLGLDETELVLTSAEFGDAYLRNGWASRYVYDLARTHVLVLVGYGADDPPMRYLLETLEADRERYPDIRRLYAFAEVKAGQEILQEALWRAKGIEPILYRAEDGDGHVRLYRTLKAWGEYAQNPTVWRRERLRPLMAQEPAKLGQAEQAEVLSLLSHGDAERILRELTPMAAWLPVLRQAGTFSENRASPGPWIARRIDDVEMIHECAAAPPTDEHSLRCIAQAVEDSTATLPQEQRRAWNLIRRASATRQVGALPPWYDVRPRVSSRDIDHEVREAVAATFKPRLQVRRPYGDWLEEPTANDGTRRISALVRTEFEPVAHSPSVSEVLSAWPEEPEAEARLLRVLNRALEDALEEARDAGQLAGLDRTNQDVPSISAHPQNSYRHGCRATAKLTPSRH